jgi:hypothetical protein
MPAMMEFIFVSTLVAVVWVWGTPIIQRMTARERARKAGRTRPERAHVAQPPAPGA